MTPLKMCADFADFLRFFFICRNPENLRTIQLSEYLFDPCRGRLIPAPPRINPSAGQRIAIRVQRAPIVGRRAPLASPNREHVTIHFIDVIERHSIQEVVETRFDVLAGFFSKELEMSDNLHPLDFMPGVIHINALDQEKAALRPLVGNSAFNAPGLLPGADQFVQAFEVRMRSRRLVVRHFDFSFFKFR